VKETGGGGGEIKNTVTKKQDEEYKTLTVVFSDPPLRCAPKVKNRDSAIILLLLLQLGMHITVRR
jgi:hypothetical protein